MAICAICKAKKQSKAMAWEHYTCSDCKEKIKGFRKSLKSIPQEFIHSGK